MNDILVADGEADAPSGHVVALGQREELDADLLGSRHLQKTRRVIAVESQIGVGQIVNNDQVVLLGGFDDPFEKVQLDDLRGRIMRES